MNGVILNHPLTYKTYGRILNICPSCDYFWRLFFWITSFYLIGIVRMILFVRHTMESPWGIGILSLMLIVVPIIGMNLVHKYGWQHWEPFYHEPDSETTRKSE